jgi:phosphatidylinositol alpha-mannosyltransferase
VGAYDELEKLPFALQARHLRLNDIHFVGRVSEAELARYYRTADVFCAPSTGMESFGMVLLEAMASGVPIVASDIAGYHEVMDNGAQGILVEPEQPAALASALVTLLRDPQRRRAMSIAGLEKAQGFSWRVVAARVLDYYAAVRERIRAVSPERAARPSAQIKSTI